MYNFASLKLFKCNKLIFKVMML